MKKPFLDEFDRWVMRTDNVLGRSIKSPSIDTLSVLSNEITVGKLGQFLASLRSPLQTDEHRRTADHQFNWLNHRWPDDECEC